MRVFLLLVKEASRLEMVHHLGLLVALRPGDIFRQAQYMKAIGIGNGQASTICRPTDLVEDASIAAASSGGLLDGNALGSTEGLVER